MIRSVLRIAELSQELLADINEVNNDLYLYSPRLFSLVIDKVRPLQKKYPDVDFVLTFNMKNKCYIINATKDISIV
jgi:hypothetical protein